MRHWHRGGQTIRTFRATSVSLSWIGLEVEEGTGLEAAVLEAGGLAAGGLATGRALDAAA